MIQPSAPNPGADVVVVGAGPAGAALAGLLSREGRDVLLLDRARFPRAKPCGDCLSPGALPLLRRLGVAETVEAAGASRVRRWRVVAPDGAFFEAEVPPPEPPGLALPRHRLDEILLRRAAADGARVLLGVRVQDLLRGSSGVVRGVTARDANDRPLRVRCGLLVGADGLRSVVARRAGLARPLRSPHKLSLTAHVAGVGGERDRGELHLLDGLCAGLAPVGDEGPGRLWNVTLVADARRFGGAVRRDAVGFFGEALARFPGLLGRLPDRWRSGALADVAERSGNTATAGPTSGGGLGRAAAGNAGGLLASGPFHRPPGALQAPGVALVGDAAGYYDPFTGQGIHHALLGASMLADAVLAAGRGEADRALRCFAARYRWVLREAHLMQRMVEAVVSRPDLCRLAVRRLGDSPEMAGALLRATGDLAPPHRLLRPGPLLRFLRL